MNENLARIVADLFAKAKGGEDLSSELNRVSDEIKKVIDDTIFGKLRALIESFREVIPDEKQRYHAAIKALSTTSKLSRQDIVSAVNSQLEELRILEKVLIPALPGRRDDSKSMETKSQEMRNEISRLREKIAQLEKEEKEIADRMAARENEMELVEKAMRKVFTDMGAEITSIKKQVEELFVESAASQLFTDRNPVKGAAPQMFPEMDPVDFYGEKNKGSEQKSAQLSSPLDTKAHKKCPMCGGQMSFYMTAKKWQCYSCGYEEPEKDEVQVIYAEKSEPTNPPEPTPSAELKKKCPMCGGQMDFYISAGNWQCYSCGYEGAEKEEVQVKHEEKSEQADPPEPIPASELVKKCPVCGGQMSFYRTENMWQCYSCAFEAGKAEVQVKYEEKSEHANSPEPPPTSELRRKCPMCGGQMDFYLAEGNWQCYSCGFEYLEKDEAQGKSEEKSKHSSPLKVLSAADAIFEYPGSKKISTPSKNQSSIKKKTCPACAKKMLWREEEKAWECRYCGYERRI